MRKRLLIQRNRFLKKHLWKTRLVFWFGAILVGAVAALFALMSEVADDFYRDNVANVVWLPFIVTPLGLVFVAWLTRTVFVGSEGSGIPQTLVALDQTGSSLCKQILSVRVAIGKFILTTIGLFVGVSVGREGPTVHLGAAIMYSLGRYTHLPSKLFERGLILAGGGAGIAAAFNTPLAGIVFAIEEMARAFDRRNSGMMLISIILAGLTAIIIHQENYNYYGISPTEMDLSFVWWLVLICGVIGGLLGGTFSQILLSGSALLRPYMRSRSLQIAFICGLIIAVLGYFSGGLIYGTGYIEAKQIVSCAGLSDCNADVGFQYPFLKMLATIASYLSGIPGGIFAPSLASGAGLGSNLAAYFPAELSSTIVVLAMVGYFSGVVQTPITAFVIVMEMTDNQDLVLAMMATSLIATGTSKLICHKSIYVALAENFLLILKQTETVTSNKDIKS